MRIAKMIVCCHKLDVMATQKPYLPIHVGKVLSTVDMGIQSDAEGENISAKNRSYCELTGMYWAWKNMKNVDVIGLCHYRRYFDFHGQCNSVLPETCFATEQFDQVDLTIPEKIIEGLREGEAYVVKPRFYRESLFVNYCVAHCSDDIRTLENFIMTTQSEDIRWAWFEYMHRNCQLRHYNMFLMTWSDFDAYCSWLFPLLEEMERRIDITHYSPLQGRIWGYMAERLMNVWLLANHFRLHEKPVIWFNDCPRRASRSRLKYHFNLLRSKIALVLTQGKYNNYKKAWQCAEN